MNIEKYKMSSYSNSNISLEIVEIKNQDALLRIYKESRFDLLWIDGMSEGQKEAFIEQQFEIEKHQIMMGYPEAQLNMIMFQGKPVGRIYIYYGKDTDRILEIGLLEGYRNQGIGGNIVRKVIEKAVEKKKTVSLQVAWFNQSAYRFYENLGFKMVENNGITYEMKYISK